LANSFTAIIDVWRIAFDAFRALRGLSISKNQLNIRRTAENFTTKNEKDLRKWQKVILIISHSIFKLKKTATFAQVNSIKTL
jgi:hypothetical protein